MDLISPYFFWTTALTVRMFLTKFKAVVWCAPAVVGSSSPKLIGCVLNAFVLNSL